MHSKIFTEGNTSENPRDIAMKKKKTSPSAQKVYITRREKDNKQTYKYLVIYKEATCTLIKKINSKRKSDTGYHLT